MKAIGPCDGTTSLGTGHRAGGAVPAASMPRSQGPGVRGRPALLLCQGALVSPGAGGLNSRLFIVQQS